jgi:RNA recognition motif-containing protein
MMIVVGPVCRSPDEDKRRSDEREPNVNRKGTDLSMDGSDGKENENRSPAKVHVGCLTRNVTEAHVREIFETYGPLVSVELAIDKAVNIPLGFAYVEYERVEDAEKAKKYMNGGQIDGNVVTVQFLDKDGASHRGVERSEEQPREFQREYGRRGNSPPLRRPYEPYRDRDRGREMERGRGRGRGAGGGAGGGEDGSRVWPRSETFISLQETIASLPPRLLASLTIS